MDKVAVAAIVQRNGGNISVGDLTEEIMKDGISREDATDIVNEFKSCRLVAFDGDKFSFI